MSHGVTCGMARQGAVSLGPVGAATDWSIAAIPSKSAERAEAASGGASMTTRPSVSRRTWRRAKSPRTSGGAASGAAAAAAVGRGFDATGGVGAGVGGGGGGSSYVGGVVGGATMPGVQMGNGKARISW